MKIRKSKESFFITSGSLQWRMQDHLRGYFGQFYSDEIRE